MKSTTGFFKDQDTKFGTVNYSTDICITSIEQNTFYSMAASVLKTTFKKINNKKIYIWMQSSRADLEKDTLKIYAKFMENACKGAHSSAKLLARSLQLS